MDRKLLFGIGAVIGAAVGAGAAAAAVGAARKRTRERSALAERLRAAPSANGRNIVILGAGFGGITTAEGLLRRLPPESGWTVTLVDRRNYFLFTPLLYHAATGLVDPSSILYPVRSLSRASNYRFREASVEGIDLKSKRVLLDAGELSYDVLVIALGSVTNFFGHEAALHSALTLKTSGDAIALRNRVIDAFEAADVSADPETRRRNLTFAVVGGGATGVELAGALRGLVRGTLALHYPRIRPDEVRVLLFEAGKELLPGLPRGLATHATTRLRDLGVELRLACPVENATADELVTAEGERIPTRTVVWAAGVSPSPLAAEMDVPKLRGGRLSVEQTLQVPGHPGVYALGDIASTADAESGRPLPPSAAVAVQQGRALPEIVVQGILGETQTPFVFEHRGELVSLGRHEAVADLNGVQLTGFPAWIAWRAFYLSQLMSVKNQAAVALDWSFAYAYQRETVRLDVPGEVPAT